jgi:tetratricopeptide (TPR) repeat protein
MKHLIAVSAVVLGSVIAGAQSPTPGTSVPSPALAALRVCTHLVDAGKAADAEAPGKVAESLYKERLAQSPRDVEALVGAARAMSQCLVPSADFLKQGELSAEAMELLDRALEIQPDHWLARFVLASIAFRSPAFLGRGKRAAKELDELLRMQGDRTDDPMFARVFALRGLQLSREKQADSAHALWTRGAALFPNDAELKELAARRARTGTTAREGPTVGAASTSDTDSPRSAVSSSLTSRPTLSAVKVVASASPPKAPLPSVKEISRSQVLMTAGGAADVLQAVQMLPGATRVGEGGDVSTRGGDAGETSLIVNGGRLLSLSRFEGLSGSMFGAIEPFVVKSVRYSSGGFSAQHGNALSGVLEIETDGRPRERATRVGLSLVQASGTFRAPMGKRVGGWVSGRASHTGALLKTHGRTDEFHGAPQSQEVIASVIAAPTPFTELRATGIVERDNSHRYVAAAGWRGTFDARGDTRALLLSSRWMASTAPVVIRASLAGSSRSSSWGFGVLARDRDESSATARVDAEWEAKPGLLVRTGAEHGAQTRLDRGTVPTTASVAAGAPARVLDDAHATANQFGGYTEAELTRGGVSLTTGIRADRLPGESEWTIDPRVAVAARIGSWTTRLSGGVFHQGRWRGDAAIPDPGAPSGLARAAQHVVLGIEREGQTSLLRAETYVKRYTDFRAFGPGPIIEGGLARGMDVLAQRVSGPVTGWLGYSFLDAHSRLSDGTRVRSAFDVTHSATGSITAALSADWSVGSTMRYGTGAPRTPIVAGQRTSDGRIEPIYGPLMSERLPAYARLDARVMRYIRTPRFLLTTFVEVLNATDRRNVSTFTYDPTYTSRDAVHTFFSKRTIVAGGEFMFRP